MYVVIRSEENSLKEVTLLVLPPETFATCPLSHSMAVPHHVLACRVLGLILLFSWSLIVSYCSFVEGKLPSYFQLLFH